MDDAYTDESKENADMPSEFQRPPRPEGDTADDAWGGVGARRGPRRPAEGVRIIGAEEAAAAIESGEVASRRPEDAPRFGDVPETPAGPRPELRFPGADPATVAKPAVVRDEATSHDPLGLATPGRPSTASGSRRVPGLGLWDDPAPQASSSGLSVHDDAGRQQPSGFWDDTAGRRVEVGSGEERPARSAADASSTPRPSASSGLGEAAGAGTREPSAGSEFDRWDQPLTPRRPGEGSQRSTRASAGRSPSGATEREAPGLGGSTERAAPAQGRTGPIIASAGSEEGGSTALPHWTEPPSGENPRILGNDEPAAGDDDLDAWSVLSSAPRWRDQPTDWDTADFDDAVLADEETRVGALSGQVPVVDDPFAFEDAPAAVEAAPPPTRIGRPSPRPSPLPTDYMPSASGGQGGDLATRVITGAIALGVVLAAAQIGPAALLLIITVAVTMAAAELFQAIRIRGYQPATLLALVATAALMGSVYWKGQAAQPLVLSIVVVFALLWYLTGVVRARPAMNVAVTVMGFLYVGFLGSFAAVLLKFPDRLGITLLLGAVVATAAYDIGAFFVGRWAGKTPLAPEISPNKTFEGLVGGSLAALLVCLVVVSRMHPWDGGKAFLLAVVVSVAAPLGDLCESLIKRDLDVKDMGTVLPGHGGVLDRIDALLFVVPATYYLTLVVF